MMFIEVNGAREHNLKSVSVRIPKNRFILVTGVSGSGKSSLVQNVIANQGQSLYLSQLNSKARQYFSKITKPEVDSVKGLSPVVALDQVSYTGTIRSTVGTLSELYDMLRLLFARYSNSIGNQDSIPSRSLFSFNLPEGACPACRGLGREEYIDPETFIIRPEKSVMDGAISLTNPQGYIIYSQVTLDVLKQVCEAEGFSLDKPWNELSSREQNVILYGSPKLKIAFGKHPLESRLKWTGITAKPRDEGYYKGMIPVMEEILKRDRNKNILKYTRSRMCKSCGGSRLNREALGFKWKANNIAWWAGLTVSELKENLTRVITQTATEEGERIIVHSMLRRIDTIEKLGLDYLSLDRESSTLSSGEIKRLRLSTIIQNSLSGLIYTLDEPTAGLHPRDHENLLQIMREVSRMGNTMIVIDHKNIGFDYADFWIEMGPGAGYNGGQILAAAGRQELIPNPNVQNSLSLAYLTGKKTISRKPVQPAVPLWITARNIDVNNLHNVTARFMARRLNIICGVSGAGKSSLLSGALYPLLSGMKIPGSEAEISHDGSIQKVIWIDQKPIGRNSRSNPATYTKLFDRIRDLFGSLPEAKARGWDKSYFSFNIDSGRCPECQGAGAIETGIGYLGSVEIECESCQGKRYTGETLEISYRNKNIHEILEMEVDEALHLFRGEKKIEPYLIWLSKLGLGYLKLGQASGTLSGGEAQRIKLAAELVRPPKGHTVYLLDEPASGLHPYDIQTLLAALDELVRLGHTLIMVEHDTGLVSVADWLVEIGPGGGSKGGRIIFSGTPEDLKNMDTPMAEAVRKAGSRMTKPDLFLQSSVEGYKQRPENIHVEGIRTNNLKGIDITIPYNKVTAITGVSGSGKTSLVYDTLYASAQYYFSQTFSSYVRTLLGGNQPGDFRRALGLLPSLAINQTVPSDNPRSTLGTLSGVLPVLRLLFSRFALDPGGRRPGLLSRHFSFNDKAGACNNCGGLGFVKTADYEKLVTHPGLPVKSGALSGTKAGRFFADPDGQYMAILTAVEKFHQKDFSPAWQELAEADRDIILFGTGERQYEVVWNYKRKSRSGSHGFMSEWKGFAGLVTEEYLKKTGTTRQESLENVMKKSDCPVCKGHRIDPARLKYQLGHRNISEWLELPAGLFLKQVRDFISDLDKYGYALQEKQLIENSFATIIKVTETLSRLGLDYLQMNRPVASLSSGEYQRVRLASRIGSELTGMLYLVDEPSTALHPSNLEELWKVFREISLNGNTMVMVDHNPLFYQRADVVYELGPGGGSAGGEIISCKVNSHDVRVGSNQQIRRLIPEKRHGFDPGRILCRFQNLSANNLKISALSIPEGWTCIAGVSGSGKSTLIREISERISHCDKIEYDVIVQDQSGKWLWNHNPLYGLGVLNLARQEFCKNLDDKSIKLNPDFLLLTGKGGRCEKCQGKGFSSISLDFLGKSDVKCEKCGGSGYSNEARKYRSGGLSFDRYLDMPLEVLSESCYWPSVRPAIEMAIRMGLGYLKAGQNGNSLSPGEKQRLTLVRELLSGGEKRSIFLFDEPARGLHKKDTGRFVELLRELTLKGHSLIMVEHQPEIIVNADWLIELGPGGGTKGGNNIFNGEPDLLVRENNTPTAEVLNKMGFTLSS